MGNIESNPGVAQEESGRRTRKPTSEKQRAHLERARQAKRAKNNPPSEKKLAQLKRLHDSLRGTHREFTDQHRANLSKAHKESPRAQAQFRLAREVKEQKRLERLAQQGDIFLPPNRG